METLKKYILYFLVGIVICLVGASGVFADTTIDTSTWVDISGRNWSLTGLEYSSSKTFNNDVLLNNYNVTGGIYTPPSEFDYITFSFFEHNTSIFNPCNSTSKFTATFRLLFTTPSFVNYIDSVKWNTDNCSITSKNSTNGWVDVSCIASPSSNNYTDIFVNYVAISGTNTSSLYITRNIDIACGLNTDAIINNDNANTQNIINNNNQNTQDIINNNNQNTQSMIDSQKVCKSVNVEISASTKDSFPQKGYLQSSGSTSNDNNFRVSDYIPISKDSSYSLNRNMGRGNGTYYCLYTNSKSLISCSSYGSSLSISITPTQDGYIRFSGEVVSVGGINVTTTFNGETCTNGNQALDDSINNLDDTLNDDDTSGATSEASDFFSDFNTDTFGLTSIITAPLNLIQSLTSSTCNDLELPLPYLNNKKLILPCMTTIYSTHFGSFFTIYQTITYGIIAYWVCVRIFNLVKDFKNPEHDEIEVLDL